MRPVFDTDRPNRNHLTLISAGTKKKLKRFTTWHQLRCIWHIIFRLLSQRFYPKRFVLTNANTKPSTFEFRVKNDQISHFYILYCGIVYLSASFFFEIYLNKSCNKLHIFHSNNNNKKPQSVWCCWNCLCFTFGIDNNFVL